MNINPTTKSTRKRFDEQLKVDCIIVINLHRKRATYIKETKQLVKPLNLIIFARGEYVGSTSDTKMEAPDQLGFYSIYLMETCI